MQISRFLKGSTSIPELDNMPAQQVHCIYKSYIEYTLAQQRAMEEQDKKDRVNNNKNLNKSNNNQAPVGIGIDSDDLEEMMEDMM